MLYSLILTTFMFFQCNTAKERSGTDAAQFNPYFPVGNNYEWQYVNEKDINSKSTFRITEFKAYEDSAAAVFSKFPMFADEERSSRIKVNKDGSVYYNHEMMYEMNDGGVMKWVSETKNYLIIPTLNNLKKDHNWTSDIWTGYVESTDGSLSIGNKTYNDVLKINLAAGYTYTVELWLAKDIGVVQWGSFRTNPPTMNISYNVLEKFIK